jgi:MFS superfamily sulfate permease-like transporter
MQREQQYMTSLHTDSAQVGRYYTGVLFATTLIMAGAMFASLLGLWRLGLIEPDLKLRSVGLGIMGGIGYLATVVNLFRLRRKLRT